MNVPEARKFFKKNRVDIDQDGCLRVRGRSLVLTEVEQGIWDLFVGPAKQQRTTLLANAIKSAFPDVEFTMLTGEGYCTLTFEQVLEIQRILGVPPPQKPFSEEEKQIRRDRLLQARGLRKCALVSS